MTTSHARPFVATSKLIAPTPSGENIEEASVRLGLGPLRTYGFFAHPISSADANGTGGVGIARDRRAWSEIVGDTVNALEARQIRPG